MPKSAKKDFPAEWKGQNSGVSAAGQFVAKTQAEWEKLWNATFSINYPSPKPPKLPKGKMALGIFTGNSSNPSEIDVMKVEEKDGQTVVSWKARSESSMLCVMNDPYLLKWVEKTDSPVVFQRERPEPAKPAATFGGPGFTL